ncbi:hypothetical protein J6590_015948 [Homalodisca vitripennis]|nr:hypothetical protein J6590_015948 [Homalodisca vitripennis]
MSQMKTQRSLPHEEMIPHHTEVVDRLVTTRESVLSVQPKNEKLVTFCLCRCHKELRCSGLVCDVSSSLLTLSVVRLLEGLNPREPSYLAGLSREVLLLRSNHKSGTKMDGFGHQRTTLLVLRAPRSLQVEMLPVHLCGRVKLSKKQKGVKLYIPSYSQVYALVSAGFRQP